MNDHNYYDLQDSDLNKENIPVYTNNNIETLANDDNWD